MSIVPSPRPVASAGMPSRTSCTGTLLAPSVIEQHARGPAAGLDDAADQALGRAHRLADADPGGCAGVEGGEAAAGVEGRADDAGGGDLVGDLAAQLQQRLQPAILEFDRARLDQPLARLFKLAS